MITRENAALHSKSEGIFGSGCNTMICTGLRAHISEQYMGVLQKITAPEILKRCLLQVDFLKASVVPSFLVSITAQELKLLGPALDSFRSARLHVQLMRNR